MTLSCDFHGCLRRLGFRIVPYFFPTWCYEMVVRDVFTLSEGAEAARWELESRDVLLVGPQPSPELSACSHGVGTTRLAFANRARPTGKAGTTAATTPRRGPHNEVGGSCTKRVEEVTSLSSDVCFLTLVNQLQKKSFSASRSWLVFRTLQPPLSRAPHLACSQMSTSSQRSSTRLCPLPLVNKRIQWCVECVRKLFPSRCSSSHFECQASMTRECQCGAFC